MTVSSLRLALLALAASCVFQTTWAFLAKHGRATVAKPASTDNLPSFTGTVKKPSSSQLCMAQMTFGQLVERVDSYSVSVPKPLGVIFGENDEPYFGLVVDDVAEGYNGGKAGLRVGDQLLAVNGIVVVGKDFGSVMETLQNESGNLELTLHRGPVRQLFTILGNQLEDGESIYEDDDEEDSEVVVMDENYESPVRVEVKEEKPLTPGDFFKAIGKVGSMVAETLTEDTSGADPATPKKKTGFFGIGAESIQLDGTDAKGYRQEKPKPDE